MTGPDQRPRDTAIDTFGRDVVAAAVDDGIDVVHYHLQRLNTQGAALPTGDAKQLAREAARIAAEGAMAAFFANHELVGTYRITLETEAGEKYDLGDEFGAPLTVAFDSDGWLPRFSKHISKAWCEARDRQLGQVAGISPKMTQLIDDAIEVHSAIDLEEKTAPTPPRGKT